MTVKTKYILALGVVASLIAICAGVFVVAPALEQRTQAERRVAICSQAYGDARIAANCVTTWNEIAAADCRGPRVTNRTACLAAVVELERLYEAHLWERARAVVATEAIVDEFLRTHGEGGFR